MKTVRWMGGDLEKHNQGHHRVSLEKHTKKIQFQAIFFLVSLNYDGKQ